MMRHYVNSDDRDPPRWRVVEYGPTEPREQVQKETVEAIAQFLRDQADQVIQRIAPADAREAEDCNLVGAALRDAADSITKKFKNPG